MKTTIRALVLLVVITTLSLWVTLQTHKGQAWSKKLICDTVKAKSDFELSVGQIQGIPPFSLSLENVDLIQIEKGSDIPWEKKLLHAGHVQMIPNWFSILFGNFSFFYVGLDKVEVHEWQPNNTKSETEFYPQKSISISYLSAEGVKLPEQFRKPFLNNLYKDVDVNLLYSLRGKLAYNAEAKSIACNVEVEPSIGDTAPFLFDCRLNHHEQESTLQLAIDAENPPAGSAFIALPCDELQANLTLDLAHKNGSWQLSGTKKKQSKTIFPEGIRFTAAGTVDAAKNAHISFFTTKLECEEFLTKQFNADENRFPEHEIHKIPIEGSLKADLLLSDQIALSIQSDSIAIRDQTIADVQANLIAKQTDSEWQGTVDLQATLEPNRLPMKGFCNWAWNQHNKASLDNILLQIATTKCTGKIDVSLYPLQLTGALHSTSKEFGPLLALWGIDGNAKATLTCTFTPDELSQQITANLDLENITSKAFVCEKATCKWASKGLLPNPEFTLAVEIEHLANKQATIDKGSLHLTEETYQIDLAGQGKNCPFTLLLTGNYTPTAVTIEKAVAKVSNTVLENSDPIQWEKSAKGCKSSPICLLHNGKKVFTAQYEQTGDQLFARSFLDDFPIELFDPFFDISLFGTTSGQIELFGKKINPQAHVSLATSDLTFSPKELIASEPLMASLQLDLANSRCHLHTEIQGLSIKKPLSCELTLPLKLSIAPYNISYEPKGALSGTIAGELEIEPLFAAYMEDDETVTGRVAIDAKVTGTAETPNVKGQIVWNDGSLLIPGIGCALSNIDFRSELENDKLILKQFSANDNLHGNLKLAGSAQLSLINGLHYNLDGVLEKYEIVKRDEAEITTSGTFAVSGTEQSATLTGSLTVDQAKLTLSPHVSHDIPTMEVIYKTKSVEPLFFKKEPFPVSLDLDVSIPESGKLVGLGLDSTWKGHLHAAGTTQDLHVQGSIMATNGLFRFADKSFTIKQGTVDFKGDLFSQSYLHLIAAHEVQEVSTEIVLKGPLADPKILFQSNPAMKEKEILSWILFNKSSSEITPMEGLQLAQTLLKLRSNDQGVDLIAKLKETLGLDRIEFGTANSVGPQAKSAEIAQNEVSFQIGKYVSDGVIVTLSKDVTNEVNRVGVTAELAKLLTAEAYVGDDAETEVALRFKYRY